MDNRIVELKKALAEEFEVSADAMDDDNASLVDVLNIDSLDMVDVVVIVESVTGVKLLKTDFRKLTTIGEFFSMVESRMA